MEIYIYVPGLRPTHGIFEEFELKGIGREGEGFKLDHRF